MNTITAPETPSTDALRLWLDLVKNKLANDYDNGELHWLVIDCDIDPRLTRESSEAFAKVVQDVVGGAQLAGMIESGYFANLDSEHALPNICPDHSRKNNSEYIKTRSVDSIANMIIGEVEDRHLPVEECQPCVDAILADFRGRLVPPDVEEGETMTGIV